MRTVGGGGRGVKMAKMLRTYYMDAPLTLRFVCKNFGAFQFEFEFVSTQKIKI